MRQASKAFLFLALIAGAFFVIDRFVAPIARENTPAQVIEAVGEKQISEESEEYVIDVVYPVTRESAVNADIELFMDEQIADFKKIVQETFDPRVAVGPYSLLTHFKTFSSGSLLSFEIVVSLDTGGAHPNHFVETRTYDMNTGERLTFENVFIPEAPARLSTLIQNDLLGRLSEVGSTVEWIEDGTEPVQENFEGFVISGDTIQFFFSPYHVAPYAAGVQSVTFPLVTLADIFTEEFKNKTS
ncbi:hypothetical protein COU17_00515 [Candidatus Kaiserbacteria bacterium CG10_big_fil_rev_8_21_14_0_10_49_17]|uniref:DUF3298 domain-containing protein n=1 Tax=Candidatus Kaiserbacteria bacterium CG10_big_fil_rev_8_21_14_0_10_49_17 TaxID=1974609 RepID=A0A2M6WFB4_9BACT|nr:MAG: hypothetical protein COU17_00515 [Candidatus Kaiserbacteria bacterium CG10_big_fil_rev_8_21_14_0_10_49_17]